ncbi:hypothetical protein BC830DRAFT_1159336 [Chytriomyces sp. MP71]|nr:hypothetical protein BC830DRAFT_1159336 [Chytriomyces sp. MP71]
MNQHKASLLPSPPSEAQHNATTTASTGGSAASSTDRLASIAVKAVLLLASNAADSRQISAVKRIATVFVQCSTKASDARAKALPTNILCALFFAHKVFRKASGSPSTPDHIAHLIADPAKLLLASLILAEASLSDSQTSSASWARLLAGGYDSVPSSESRHEIARIKWSIFEFMDYNVVIPREQFSAWCLVIRKLVGDGLFGHSSSYIPFTSTSCIASAIPATASPFTAASNLAALASAVAKSCVAAAAANSCLTLFPQPSTVPQADFATRMSGIANFLASGPAPLSDFAAALREQQILQQASYVHSPAACRCDSSASVPAVAVNANKRVHPYKRVTSRQQRVQ